MNLHLYPSPFTTESRMLKELDSIVQLGLADEAVVLGICQPGLERQSTIGERQRLIRLEFRLAPYFRGKIAKMVEYAEYLAGALRTGWTLRPDVLNCHSLNVLPVGVALKKMGRVQWLIYDAHELETERETLRGPAKWASKKLERLLIRHVDHVIVVSQPIAEWYVAAYPGTLVSVVRNVPNRQPAVAKNDLFRQSFNIPVGDRICIYQGILAESRGVKALLETFADVEGGWHIVFMGFGPAEGAIREASSKTSNIHFQPAVKPEDIISYTASADVGLLFLDHQISLSYRYSLPNKFFEYVYGGCPVIVSQNLEHISDLVRQYDIGWPVAPDVQSLRVLLAGLDHGSIARSRVNGAAFVHANSWEDDEQKLIAVFGGMGMNASNG